MKKIVKSAVILIARLSSFTFTCRSTRQLPDVFGIQGALWILKGVWFQKILRFNSSLPYPASPACRISNYKNLRIKLSSFNSLQSPGTYFQNFDANIVIGERCFISQNVGIITSNHNPKDLKLHLKGQDVVIGNDCWVGMNSVLLPGVILGPYTVVGAGSVVNKSFESGYCVVAGNPAKMVKELIF